MKFVSKICEVKSVVVVFPLVPVIRIIPVDFLPAISLAQNSISEKYSIPCASSFFKIRASRGIEGLIIANAPSLINSSL